MKTLLIIDIFIILILSVYSTDFGKTTLELNSIAGTTVFLIIKTEYNGTTVGSFSISNQRLYCLNNDKLYDITCQSEKQYNFTNVGTKIQCSIPTSISSTSSSIDCYLVGKPTILSTGDTFNIERNDIVDTPKFGDVSISLISVEGKKVIINLTPAYTGTTTTEDLVVKNLQVLNKALTCKAGKKIILQASTGTSIECSANEEIEANRKCTLGGNPVIYSTDDTFGQISIKTGTVTSSFGEVKVGLYSVRGTYVTLFLIPEYEGEGKIDITGLKINETRTIECPEIKMEILKEGTKIECAISQAINEDDVCLLTQNNLKSTIFNKLVINEEGKKCIARSSKFGKVYISLKSIIGYKITLLIKTTFSGTTESSKFTIYDLKLHVDNTDKKLYCSQSSKIKFENEGTDFVCTLSYSLSGGKECSLKGVPTFESDGDTFSDIIVSNNTLMSSFGNIEIRLESIVGKNVKLILSPQYSGKTTSSVLSINNLKLQSETSHALSCEINANIDFSNKNGILCELDEIVDGNINFQLLGEEPKINSPENSRDVFGNIILNTNKATSLFGKLEIGLRSVVGKEVTINLKSEYKGTLTKELKIYYLYLNGQSITCHSGGVSLELKNEEDTSNANIECYFSSSYYSQESNTSCVLTGTPSASLKLFTSLIITSNNQVVSGTRNFGESTIYLSSIKGTTVNIELKTSLSGIVRPIISNLKLQVGEEILDVECDISEKIQLYENSRKKIKCYIQKTISGDPDCRLYSVNNIVSITTDCGDKFGKVNLDQNPIRQTTPKYGDTEITLNKIIGTEIKIDIFVSITTIINSANLVIHNLYLDGHELYCIASQSLYFINNKAQMSCFSSESIVCTDCQLSGTPTIVSFGDSEDSFGQTTLISKEVKPTKSSLGEIFITLQEVIGNYVYIGVSSAKNGKSTQQVDINNLYIDGQLMNCSDNIIFSTTSTRMKCTVKEPIPYNKNVEITGTPNIKIYSDEESADVVKINEVKEIKSKSNSGLILNLVSVKENYAIISVDMTDISIKTLFKNFILIGLAINNIPIEIELKEIYLGGGAVQIKAKLNETIERDVPCSLTGVNTAQIKSEGNTFGPILSNSGTVYSSNFKFGEGIISLLYVQGYSVILKIQTTKSDYTKNTSINDLYINNIPLICNFNDDIEFTNNGTDVECRLGTPVNGDVYCTLKYSGDGDDNFEKITVNDSSSRIYSSFKDFGNVTIALKAVNGKNVKIFVKTENENITTTNNFEIKNLYINGKEITCKINDYIEFVYKGNELECTLSSLDSTETYNLTGKNIEIISFADFFSSVIIDEQNSTIKASPKNIDTLAISLSSVAGDRASLKLTTLKEIYSYIKIENLKIKKKDYPKTYSLICPIIYIQLDEKNEFSDIIKCSIETDFPTDMTLSLVDDKNVSIASYDDFNNIIIETNEVISTNFGDTIINYISSSIVLEVIPTFPTETSSPLYINNIKLSSLSDMTLDCGTLEAVKLKETGTKIYCTLKGSVKVDGVNNKLPYLEAGAYDKFGNILLEKKLNNLQSTDCYSIYNKESCEENPSCVFTKETFAFCENRNNNILEWNQTNNEIDNECLLYINEETCESKNKCLWNIENIYLCKKKEIKNCLKLDSLNSNKCELCDINYELNSEKTECIKTNNVDYTCRQYNNHNECNNNPQCTYSDKSYNYCAGDSDEETAFYKCNLYLTEESCKSQNYCSWKTNNGPGCRDKYVDGCEKLRESDPTSCEKCKEGYNLLSGMCTKGDIEEKSECQKHENDKSDCIYFSNCEFSSREFCSGEDKECYRYLDKNLCQNSGCNWEEGSLEESCKEKKIDHCLILAKTGHACERCEDGYNLYDTLCKYSDFHLCFEYYDDEERCFYNERCEYSNKEHCDYKFGNGKCDVYLEKSVCEEDSNCFWNTKSSDTCKNKGISNCLELKYEDTFQCKRCKEGYQLSNENTECKHSESESESQFINISFLILGFVLLLL